MENPRSRHSATIANRPGAGQTAIMSPRSGSAVLATALTSGLYGLIAFWGSENLFWSAPTEATGILDLILTATAYSVAVASVLGAVIWSGITGWRALFFGGALLGWLVEGVLVSTAATATE